MDWLINFITERPVMFVRYLCGALLIIAGIITFVVNKYRDRH